jgi:16S rRNA (cytosine967-C5)-methyltransferase
MQKSSLIGHIIEVYSEFAGNSNIPADAVLRRFFLNRKYLGAGDRRQIASAYFGAIKNFLRLEAIAQDAFPSEIHKPELIIAAYFIVFESESAKDVQQYINNLSNEFQQEYPLEIFQEMADREREEMRLRGLPDNERLSIQQSFPLWFIDEIDKEYKDESESLLVSLNGEAPTVLRVNTTITNRDELRKELAEQGIESKLSKISEYGLILQKRINIWDLPSFKRGAFEIQDEASQLVAPFADIHSKRVKILDACAGAGGKTLHFSTLLENQGEIFATDVDPRKLEELKKRVVRSKAQNVRIVHPDQYEKILGDKSDWFDIVLLDVPCSGTGTLRRNPSIKWNLTEEMLAELIAKQRVILEKNIHFIKPGGKLLYATCSVLKSESEDQIEWFCNEHPEFLLEEMKRILPEKDGCDGFFVARLKKEIAAD